MEIEAPALVCDMLITSRAQSIWSSLMVILWWLLLLYLLLISLVLCFLCFLSLSLCCRLRAIKFVNTIQAAVNKLLLMQQNSFVDPPQDEDEER